MTTKELKFVTPLGVAVYPSLNRPDTKYNDLGIYKADVSVPIAEAKPLMDRLSVVFKEYTGKEPNKTENTMFKVEDNDGKSTVLFKLRIKNRMTKTGDLWDRKPKIFDSELTPISVNPRGGRGMRGSLETYAWDAEGKKGIGLEPMAVKIVKLVSGEDTDGKSFGFDAEDGFTADASEGFVDDPVAANDPDGDDNNGDF